MRKYRSLFLNDGRQIGKDPMLIASLLGPLALIVFARYLYPPLSDWLEQRYAFSLMDYRDFAVTFLLIVIPLLPGTMAGLLMLDERDENMISYYSVTPLARKGYVSYRLLLPSMMASLLTALFFLLAGIAEMRLESVYTLLILSLEAPCIALFLAAYAANKVEGLALSKACGLLFAGPIIVYFVPEPLQYWGVWVPTFWPAKTYILGISQEPLAALGSFGVGFAFHILLLMWFIRSFLKRID